MQVFQILLNLVLTKETEEGWKKNKSMQGTDYHDAEVHSKIENGENLRACESKDDYAGEFC